VAVYQENSQGHSAGAAQLDRTAVSSPGDVVLAIHGLTKHFGGTVALDDVSLDIRPGEVHALLGENGAGKSTLIKILAGVYAADDGQIDFPGHGDDSAEARVGFVHQDLALVDALSVAENVGLVHGYAQRRRLISWKAQEERARAILERLGSDVDPRARVADLGAGDRAIVAIARVLADRGARVVVLDEPTASLPADDVRRLFDALDAMRQTGVAVIYVTHRLDEVFQIADRVTVLRGGRKIATSKTSEIDHEELVMQIVGRPPSQVFVSAERDVSGAALEVTDLQSGFAGPVSLTLRSGEILALVGLRGAGHDVIGRAIFGAAEVHAGEIELFGQAVRIGSPERAVRLGLGFISSRRIQESLAMPMTARENLFLNPATRGRKAFEFATRTAERSAAEAILADYDVRPPAPDALISTFSGGNQQKLVLARWLSDETTRILILEDPTTGVDVGAKADIYLTLAGFVERGGCALLVSADFEEVAGVAHRALVFGRGVPVAHLTRSELTIETLVQTAGGRVDA
jgi:ribose transport system ATP-binding protein